MSHSLVNAVEVRLCWPMESTILARHFDPPVGLPSISSYHNRTNANTGTVLVPSAVKVTLAEATQSKAREAKDYCTCLHWLTQLIGLRKLLHSEMFQSRVTATHQFKTRPKTGFRSRKMDR